MAGSLVYLTLELLIGDNDEFFIYYLLFYSMIRLVYLSYDLLFYLSILFYTFYYNFN